MSLTRSSKLEKGDKFFVEKYLFGDQGKYYLSAKRWMRYKLFVIYLFIIKIMKTVVVIVDYLNITDKDMEMKKTGTCSHFSCQTGAVHTTTFLFETVKFRPHRSGVLCGQNGAF
ncbi:hypothetical protein NL108_017809 [Boleophthalmus pectinirostris]|nr:hypothetical protein NL108_017809 [Boleophthalmus pectinirostris]